ncbi:MAG: DUF2179 domain-containing protein [Clostridiales bacterium]|nr:DUF2179 domain-containing protein [Clostridiales bacterium]
MLEFLQSNSIWVYFIIFFGKITEVTFATVRIVLVNKGERIKGSIIALVEVILWIFITGTVIVGFTQAPLKALVFAAAFALGTYLGSWLEDQIALGLSTIQIITSEDPAALIAALRANNLAVTTIDAEGREGARKILSIHLKRKRIRKTVKLINNSIPNCMITVTDVKVLKGGYIRK